MNASQRPAIHGIQHFDWRQMGLRFLFGAAITAAASGVFALFGPRAAGPLLAFPSILPAALTFLQQKDGKKASISDLSGAVLGAVALTVFALVVFLWARNLAALTVLAIALVAWTVVGLTLWSLVHRLKPWREADRRDQEADSQRRHIHRRPAST